MRSDQIAKGFIQSYLEILWGMDTAQPLWAPCSSAEPGPPWSLEGEFFSSHPAWNSPVSAYVHSLCPPTHTTVKRLAPSFHKLPWGTRGCCEAPSPKGISSLGWNSSGPLASPQLGRCSSPWPSCWPSTEFPPVYPCSSWKKKGGRGEGKTGYTILDAT